MKLANKTGSRKSIVPWYDSDPVCLIAIAVLGSIFLFSLSGLTVAREVASYRNYLWVPALLAALSGVAFISIFFRLIRRYARRWRNSDEP